jgi:hypothetical protein
VDELPAVIVTGFAAMVTVGAPAAATTVTDVADEAFPPVPVAVAVYVVVAVGLTACVPPLAGKL